MLCQSCGKKPATTHIKTIVNGRLTEHHLCQECAQKEGYLHLHGGWDMDLGSLLGGFIGKAPGGSQAARCPGCGASFEEISRSGKIGCAQCYETFRSQLVPVIQRIHGTTRHKGKVPGGSALRIAGGRHEMMPVPESPLEEKKRLLKEAVEKQDFETAAQLRDAIKEMEGHG